MQQICPQCNTSFTLSDEEREIIKKSCPIVNKKAYEFPLPTLCQRCRLQNRLVWQVEYQLFKRKSAYSGKNILSIYPPSAPHKVYHHDEWYSDNWDPLEYGQDFDFQRAFFPQFAELLQNVPHLAVRRVSNENSEYVCNAGYNKNCYLINAANYNESCYYSNFINKCVECIDCTFIRDSELCYECTDCFNCYHLTNSANCIGCSESHFLSGCSNCKNCFGCINQNNKQYMFLNKQLTKEAYTKELEKLELHKRSQQKKLQAYFSTQFQKAQFKYTIGKSNENCSGSSLYNSKNSTNCFDSFDLEDCHNCIWAHSSKDCMDSYAVIQAECAYECIASAYATFKTSFGYLICNSSDVYYSSQIMNCKNIFGCVSLRNKQFCIFNKQYTEEQYNTLLPKIIEHMKKSNEWGQYFPVSMSPFAYNQTAAQDYFPLSPKEVTAFGSFWNEENDTNNQFGNKTPPDTLSSSVDIGNEIFTCTQLGKPFKIIPQELTFYKKLNLPPPENCFVARHKKRLEKRLPRTLWTRKCSQCEIHVQTPFSPERPEKILCEKCYLKKI